MSHEVRSAFFPDTYAEVDGVANTAKQFEAFARRRDLPFLLVHGGDQHAATRIGRFTRMELKRGALSFALDAKHDFDLLFLRHYAAVAEVLREFRPDVIHITGPSDNGILGALLAARLGIPLVGSWHTNLHEYAEQRAVALLRFLPGELLSKLGPKVRELGLLVISRFYQIPRVLLAPNRELIELLERHTGKACYAMRRGVDSQLFTPQKRTQTEQPFTIGYVGRLTVEKSVEVLAEIEHALLQAGERNFRFLIVGRGSSEPWLREHLSQAEFTGVLAGEELATAYANMDVFVFPSKTDTFGNVVLEALASGVPAIVTDQGGPQFIIHEGETGFVASDLKSFVDYIIRLRHSPETLSQMRMNARRLAQAASWDDIFDAVYGVYDIALNRQAASVSGMPFTGVAPALQKKVMEFGGCRR
jgi:glycosyltransferase involved in cell wall biosynthesis